MSSTSIGDQAGFQFVWTDKSRHVRTGKSRHVRTGKWLFFALAFFLLTMVSCQPASQEATPPPPGHTPQAPAQASVSMTIDAKDFMPQDTVSGIAWKPGMRVKDAVEVSVAEAFVLKEYPGMGHLVIGIGGLANNTHAGHYWQFCVDGIFSDRGIDEVPLEAGQVVSWYYRAYGEGPCKKIGEE